MKYGDSVVLIQKSGDGTITRLNAFVLRSATQPADATRANGLKNHKGDLLAEGEYLDLIFPRQYENGQPPSSVHFTETVQPTACTPPWKDGAFIGWQKGSATEVAPDPTPAWKPGKKKE